MRKCIAPGSFLVIFSLIFGNASAAELKVLITNGVKPVMVAVAPQFERSTGHKLLIKYEGSSILQEEITRDGNFDVAMLIASNMDAIAKLEKITPATRINVARTGIGVVVRAGQPKPDISTIETFRQTMLNAKSIAYVTSGVSGRHFIAICERLGIAEQVKAKGRTIPSGLAADFVAQGEAEIAVQQISELGSVKGTDLVGPFPPELNLISQIAAAVSADSKEAAAAKALVAFFTSPEVIKVIKERGMEPG